MTLIMNQAETEKNTHTKDQIIHHFAFFILSSFPQERIYKTPPHIKEITAITAVYFIRVPIQ
jgi:hypothetical protein